MAGNPEETWNHKSKFLQRHSVGYAGEEESLIEKFREIRLQQLPKIVKFFKYYCNKGVYYTQLDPRNILCKKCYLYREINGDFISGYKKETAHWITGKKITIPECIDCKNPIGRSKPAYYCQACIKVYDKEPLLKYEEIIVEVNEE